MRINQVTGVYTICTHRPPGMMGLVTQNTITKMKPTGKRRVPHLVKITAAFNTIASPVLNREESTRLALADKIRNKVTVPIHIAVAPSELIASHKNVSSPAFPNQKVAQVAVVELSSLCRQTTEGSSGTSG
mmetsp:Transcript_10335/g.19022  ORF Transcript_10335/g.19022 Transcript_10335/m.19022 type:complete len:131 (-) Transcript_10335:622-1014(-)